MKQPNMCCNRIPKDWVLIFDRDWEKWPGIFKEWTVPFLIIVRIHFFLNWCLKSKVRNYEDGICFVLPLKDFSSKDLYAIAVNSSGFPEENSNMTDFEGKMIRNKYGINSRVLILFPS